MISKSSTNTEQPSNKVVSSKTLPVLLEEIQELTIPILIEAFKTALDKTDTSFFQRAEKGKSNNEQNLYFDAMRELRIGREAAEESFDRGLRESFRNIPLASADSQVNGALKQGLELSLVKEDELEEDIALETMVTKATADNREAIYHLSMRLDALVADTHVDESNNPLSPASISEVLGLAAAGIELDIRCKIILYKQFDLTVMASLKAVLRKSNRVLVDAGVLPDLRYKASKNESNDSERAEQLTEALVSNLTELAELGAPSPGPEFQQLQGLLSQARATGAAPARFGVSGQNISAQAGGVQQGVSGQGASFQSIITPNELIGVLDNVQSEISAQGGYALSREMLHNNKLTVIPPSAVRLSIRDALAQSDEQEAKAIIEEENEDVINLVEMLFEIILDDNYLPGTIQALISRLQIPVIKVALKDRSFFDQPNHPARKLLNELAKTSIGWTPGREGKTDNLLENIYDVVHAICDAPALSVELIEEQYRHFRELCKKERKRAKLSERRTREYELGASKVKHAKTSIKSALDAICAKNVIPQVVDDILYGAWNKVLYSTYLNEGPHSQEWVSALQTAEDLVWSVQPQADAGYQGKRAKLLPKLLQNLHTGLTEISYDPFESSALFSRLENAHIVAFRAGEPNKVEPEKSKTEPQSGQDNIETQNQNDDIEIFVKQAKRKINLASKKPATASRVIDKEILSLLKNLGENDSYDNRDLPDMDAANIQSSNTVENTASDAQVDSVAYTTDGKEAENKALTAIQRQEIQLQQQESQYLENIQDLNVDDWFIFQMPGGKELRCKLIEKMSETEELVFVNRKGQKAFVKPYAEMAKDLRVEAVRILEGGSLIDRAFGRLVGKLKGSD